MLDRPATLLVVFIISVSLIACGGDESPNESANGGAPEPAALATSNAPSADATALNPTERPAAAARDSSDSPGARPPTDATMPAARPPAGTTVQRIAPGTTVEGDGNTSKESASGRNTTSGPPQFSDEVLLQDVYAGIDLDEFALDPAAEIPLPHDGHGGVMRLTGLERPDQHPTGEFPFAEVRDHPYLHIFPGLSYAVEQAEGSPPSDGMVKYDPYMTLDFKRSFHELYEFVPRNGIERFIHHPWFEPVPTSDFSGWRESSVRLKHGYRYSYQKIGPHWFGNNSTRGTLSNTVASLLEDNKLPGSEPRPMTWRTHPAIYEEVDWNLADYLRTPVYRRVSRAEIDLEEDSFRVPTTYWEFVHPELPIIKITSYVATKMPLKVAGEEPGLTYFAVSFVISFQNRWESFDDPDRWLIRFEDDLKANEELSPGSFSEAQGAIDAELHEERFPNYWHWSDYMQHQIIGPVVVQVYQSDVIAPGVYSMTPKASEWAAPGYVVPDDRQLMVKGLVVRQEREGTELPLKIDTFAGWDANTEHFALGSEWFYGGTVTDGRLSLRAVPQSPNPGYPLPGHVMTNAYTAPGTDVWEKFLMDDNEW